MTKVFAEAFGCSSNFADYEMALGLLEERGFQLVRTPREADLVIIFTCIVKTPTETKMIRRIKEHCAIGMPLVVAGCMPKAETGLVEELAPQASLLGPDAVTTVVEVVEETLRGARVRSLRDQRVPKTCIPRVRISPLVHIAPISSGCHGNCSYCIVRLARGRIFSYPSDSIVDDASEAVSSGAKEIWVTAQDTAAYDFNGVRLPELLEALCALKERFYIRVGMMTPNSALHVLDDLIKAFRDGKVFKFLHVPVQSGNNEILKRMKRKYTVEDFKSLVGRLRKHIPELSLSTDIICGFPGETEDQFEDSIRLVEQIKPDVLNISRYGSRPGTEAAEMPDQLRGWETKRRSTLLARRWRLISQQGNEKWVGWRGEVLVDERGTRGSCVGRNQAYKPIVLREELTLGSFHDVEVFEARPQYLCGKVLTEPRDS